jgi:hypothetical protein
MKISLPRTGRDGPGPQSTRSCSPAVHGRATLRRCWPASRRRLWSLVATVAAAAAAQDDDPAISRVAGAACASALGSRRAVHWERRFMQQQRGLWEGGESCPLYNAPGPPSLPFGAPIARGGRLAAPRICTILQQGRRPVPPRCGNPQMVLMVCVPRRRRPPGTPAGGRGSPRLRAWVYGVCCPDRSEQRCWYGLRWWACAPAENTTEE